MTMLAPHHTISLLGTRSSPPLTHPEAPSQGYLQAPGPPSCGQIQLDKSHPLRRKHNMGTQHVC